MPSYEFQCRECGLLFVSPSTEPVTCPIGHTDILRQWGFQGFHRQYDGGFSHAVGRYVRNNHDFDEALKAAGDAASEELGLEHRYRRMDPRDRDATRTTEE